MYGDHHQQPQNDSRNDELDPYLVVRELSMHIVHGQPPFPLSVQERSCSDIAAMTEWTPKPTLGLPNGETARTTITNAKEMPAEHPECPKQGNLVLFCPSIGLPSLPGAAPAFLSLTAWLECLRDDAWQ